MNYHAVDAFVRLEGGFALHTELLESSLKVSAFVMPPGAQPAVFLSTRVAYASLMQRFGPYDFFSLQQCIHEETRPSARLVLRLLRLSYFDADIFYKFSEAFMVDDALDDPLLRQDITAGPTRALGLGLGLGLGHHRRSDARLRVRIRVRVRTSPPVRRAP